MEKLKFRCMADLMKKHSEGSSNIHVVPVNPFIEAEKYARAFYKEKFDLIGVEDFAKMLIRDSCFIIRIILSLSQEVKESMSFIDVDIKKIRSDLLLLENQIPLFFIEKVYDWLFITERWHFAAMDHPFRQSTDTHRASLLSTNTDRLFPPFRTVLGPFICLDIPWETNHRGMSSDAAHLLDLYWRCSSPPSNDIPSHQLIQEQRTLAEIHLANNASKVIPNATTLNQMAYIKFEKLNHISHHNDGLKVVFSNGILRMPRLKIDLCQTTLLVNLIAFENSKVPNNRIFSSYMKLMDALIDTEKDVELLQQCGVIYNTMINHEMAATFFNHIGDFCLIDYNEFMFSDVYEDVQSYYDSIWNQRSAILKQNYFSNPWMGLSVLAGGTLLILSALQTFYTIYDHYNPKKNN